MTLSPEALQQTARDHLWGHFSRLTPGRRRHLGHRAGRGLLRLGQQRQALPRRPVRPVHRPGRPRAGRAGRGGRHPGRRARLLPAVDLRPPDRHRAGRPPGRARARQPQPGLLHHRRRRGRRVGLEAGPPVLRRHRPAPAAQGHLPRPRLPRHHDGGPVDHRPGRHPGAVRAAGAGRVPRPQHQPLPVPLLRRRPAVHAGLRRRDRGRHPPRGARDGGRRVPRAGAELRRLLHAVRRLLRPGARDLRPLRRAARVRRGDLRLRPARRDVRLRAPRLPARHDHHGQGPHLGLLAARRGDGRRPHRRAVPRAGRVVPARHHVRRPPGELRGGAGQPRRVRERGPGRPGAGLRGRVPRRARDAGRPADRRRDPRHGLLLRHRAGEGPGHQARRSTTRSPSACCAACSRRGCSTSA